MFVIPIHSLSRAEIRHLGVNILSAVRRERRLMRGHRVAPLGRLEIRPVQRANTRSLPAA